MAFNLTLFVVASLLVTSCSNIESGVVKPSITVSNVPTYSLSDEEKVCGLLQEAYELFYVTPVDEFFDEDLWDLLDVINPNQTQITQILGFFEDGLNLMFTTSGEFESAFYSVLSLELTEGEFNEMAEECEIIEYRWCIICNSTACARSIALNSVAQHGFWGEAPLVTWLGVFIHCDH